MIEALLCDLDGVVRHFPPMAPMEAANGVAPGSIAAVAFAPERLLAAVTGGLSDERWRAQVTAALAVQHGRSTAEALVAAWSASSGEFDDEVVAVLAAARERMPVVLVTNATTRLRVDLDRLGGAAFADAVVSSAEVGAAKPDPLIYLAAAERAGVPVERCLFVDEALPNVEAARRLGMSGLHFRSAPRLAAALDAIAADPKAVQEM